MNQYRRRPEELPRNLYQVHYSESQTLRTGKRLEAADTTTSFGDSERERISDLVTGFKNYLQHEVAFLEYLN